MFSQACVTSTPGGGGGGGGQHQRSTTSPPPRTSSQHLPHPLHDQLTTPPSLPPLDQVTTPTSPPPARVKGQRSQHLPPPPGPGHNTSLPPWPGSKVTTPPFPHPWTKRRRAVRILLECILVSILSFHELNEICNFGFPT